MALSSPESPAPQRRVFINRVETPTEEQEELNKMAHGVVAESRRYVKSAVVVFHCQWISQNEFTSILIKPLYIKVYSF